MKISKKQQKIQQKINKLLLAGIPLTALIASAGCGEEKISEFRRTAGVLDIETMKKHGVKMTINQTNPEKELDQSGKTKHFPSDNNNRPEEPTKNTDQENPIISTQGIIYTLPQKK